MLTSTSTKQYYGNVGNVSLQQSYARQRQRQQLKPQQGMTMYEMAAPANGRKTINKFLIQYAGDDRRAI